MSRPWYTTAFGAHYPLLYAHRDEAEARRCLDLLPRLVPLNRSAPVLDLGCGDGRHLKQLLKLGYPMVGLDLSPHLLAVAAGRFTLVQPSLVRGDMQHLPFSDASLGSVLSLFTAFGYFGVLSENASVVREIHRVLVPGGLWYLDYVDCDSVRRELADGEPVPRIRELGPLSVGETRRLTQNGQLVEKTVILKPLPDAQAQAAALGVGEDGVTYTEKVALFLRSELEDLARDLGLALVAGAGSYEGVPLGQGKRWIMVFRKEGAAAAGQARGGV